MLRIFHFRCSKIIFKYKIFKLIFHLAEWYQNTKCINFILVDAECVSECWMSCSMWLSVSYTVKLQLVIRFWHCRNAVLILTAVYSKFNILIHFTYTCHFSQISSSNIYTDIIYNILHGYLKVIMLDFFLIWSIYFIF